jgi:hypothetical protein
MYESCVWINHTEIRCRRRTENQLAFFRSLEGANLYPGGGVGNPPKPMHNRASLSNAPRCRSHPPTASIIAIDPLGGGRSTREEAPGIPGCHRVEGRARRFYKSLARASPCSLVAAAP